MEKYISELDTQRFGFKIKSGWKILRWYMVIPLKLLNLQLDVYLQDHGSYKIKKERPSKQGQGSQ